MKNFRLLSLFLLITAAEMHASSQAFDEQGFMKLILESMAISEMLRREASIENLTQKNQATIIQRNTRGYLKKAKQNQYTIGDTSQDYPELSAANIKAQRANKIAEAQAKLIPNDQNQMVVYNRGATPDFKQSINQAIKNNNDANDDEMYRKLAEQAKLTPNDQNQMVVYNPHARPQFNQSINQAIQNNSDLNGSGGDFGDIYQNGASAGDDLITTNVNPMQQPVTGFLQKTKNIVYGTPEQQAAKLQKEQVININLADQVEKIQNKINTTGVFVDKELSMSAQIGKMIPGLPYGKQTYTFVEPRANNPIDQSIKANLKNDIQYLLTEFDSNNRKAPTIDVIYKNGDNIQSKLPLSLSDIIQNLQ